MKTEIRAISGPSALAARCRDFAAAVVVDRTAYRRWWWRVGTVILVVFGWVALLARRVGRQTEIIRRRLQSEAVLQQRFEYVVRAANDTIWDIDVTTHELWCGERFYETYRIRSRRD